MINQDTNLYISASNRPGSFGAQVFNNLFKIKNINAVYIPRKFEDPKELVHSIKILSIQGSGVSSPLKNSVLSYLDAVDRVALKLGSVNTIKNAGNQLTGFNTDWSGAKLALEEKLLGLDQKPKSVRILGSGGVVSSLIYALENLGIKDVEIVYRNKNSAEKLKTQWGIDVKAIEGSEFFGNKDILINTIPTISDENDLIYKKFINFSTLIFDLIVKPTDTTLIQMALKEKKEVIRGYQMAIYQLIEQYRIYFNQDISSAEVYNIVQKNYLMESKDV